MNDYDLPQREHPDYRDRLADQQETFDAMEREHDDWLTEHCAEEREDWQRFVEDALGYGRGVHHARRP